MLREVIETSRQARKVIDFHSPRHVITLRLSHAGMLGMPSKDSSLYFNDHLALNAHTHLELRDRVANVSALAGMGEPKAGDRGSLKVTEIDSKLVPKPALLGGNSRENEPLSGPEGQERGIVSFDAKLTSETATHRMLRSTGEVAEWPIAPVC